MCGTAVTEHYTDRTASYFDSIHLIENAAAVVTDSGGVLQEAHFTRTPYVFVLDIPKVSDNTRFDVNRLVKPDRQMILQKVNEKQEFGERTVDSEQMNSIISRFERNMLQVLREYERKMKK